MKQWLWHWYCYRIILYPITARIKNCLTHSPAFNLAQSLSRDGQGTKCSRLQNSPDGVDYGAWCHASLALCPRRPASLPHAASRRGCGPRNLDRPAMWGACSCKAGVAENRRRLCSVHVVRLRKDHRTSSRCNASYVTTVSRTATNQKNKLTVEHRLLRLKRLSIIEYRASKTNIGQYNGVNLISP